MAKKPMIGPGGKPLIGPGGKPMVGEPGCVCCGPAPITPCIGGVLQFNPADYYLQVSFTGEPTYSVECTSCPGFAGPYLLTWVPLNNRWYYHNSTYGNAWDVSCGGSSGNFSRQHELWARPVCTGGGSLLGIRGLSSGPGSAWDTYMWFGLPTFAFSGNGDSCVWYYTTVQSPAAATSTTFDEGAVFASKLLTNGTDQGVNICQCHLANGTTSNVVTANFALVRV